MTRGVIKHEHEGPPTGVSTGVESLLYLYIDTLWRGGKPPMNRIFLEKLQILNKTTDHHLNGGSLGIRGEHNFEEDGWYNDNNMKINE